MRIDLKSREGWVDLRTLGDHRAMFEKDAALLRAIWQRPNAVVAFGGEFNCGKSTLLSALIERDVLPVGDLPETGVPCQLRGGRCDKVMAVGPGNLTRELPWDRAAIAEQIGLYRGDGSRRPASDMPDRLDIDIDSPVLRADVVWIDTPGINDDPSVTERALNLALDADVLVWVLSSRQCFSEPELAFLDRFVAERGANGLALVLNVFLPDDDPVHWERFNDREGPVLRQRIRDRLAELDASDAPLYVLSARGALDGLGDEFGMPDFRRWLGDIAGRNSANVRSSRNERIERSTESLRARIVPHIEEAERQLRIEQSHEEERQQAIAARTECLALAEQFIADQMTRFGREATTAAEQIGAKLDGAGLFRDNRYGDALTASLKDVLPVGAYCDRIDLIMERHDFGPLDQASRGRIARALAIAPLSVTVPNTPLKTGTAGATAAAVGVGLALFTGGLSLLISAAAAGAGAVAGASSAINEDIARTRTNLREAATAEHGRLSRAGSTVRSVIDDFLGPVPDSAPELGRARLAALLALDEHYRLLLTNLDG